MCGIAGYLTDAGEPGDRSLLERMCESIVHRGPDDFGCLIAPGVALGHRRLSIIDIAGGHQPLGNEDGSVQVVFNGEIYNFQQIRQQLISQGHAFRTNSDTEVLVHLYEEAGERMPEYLNGMFAFAIWDERRHELFLARDRFGKKPLHYSFSVPGSRFCFASELKAIAALPEFRPETNWKSLADFLALSYVPEPDTIYAGIHKLPAAHSLLVTSTGHKLRRYWTPVLEPDPRMRFEDAIEEIRRLAADAVSRRMISDVPLGAFLSGGVDSSAVVGYMAGAATGGVKTFSIGFTNKKFDELEYARTVAQRYSTDHHEEVVSPSIHESLGVLSKHFDEPFADSSAIPMLYLSRMTRQFVTVALCGDGADELFAGYRRYHHAVAEEHVRGLFPQWFRASVIRTGAHYYPKFDYLPQIFRAKTVLGNLAQELGDAYFTTRSAFRDAGLEAVLSPEARRALAGYSPRSDFRNRFTQYRHLGPLEQLQAVDLETWLPGDILVKADRTTMAYSLESRSPWLDHRIGELAFRLPAGFKLHGKIGKYVFKKAVEPLVPGPLIWRPKQGFSVPLAEWFQTSLRPVFESMVLSPSMEQYLSLDEVRRLWNQHQSKLHNHDQKLWALLMLACWESTHRQPSQKGLLDEALSVR